MVWIWRVTPKRSCRTGLSSACSAILGSSGNIRRWDIAGRSRSQLGFESQLRSLPAFLSASCLPWVEQAPCLHEELQVANGSWERKNQVPPEKSSFTGFSVPSGNPWAQIHTSNSKQVHYVEYACVQYMSEYMHIYVLCMTIIIKEIMNFRERSGREWSGSSDEDALLIMSEVHLFKKVTKP